MSLQDLLVTGTVYAISHPWFSHAVFGALGGLAYVLRQMMRSYSVRSVEWVARPFVGALAAWIITIVLGLPNHLTSLFVGYFGIDVWDALASRFKRQLPLSFEHLTAEEVGAKVAARVAALAEDADRLNGGGKQ